MAEYLQWPIAVVRRIDCSCYLACYAARGSSKIRSKILRGPFRYPPCTLITSTRLFIRPDACL